MSYGTHTYAGDITYAGLFAVGDLAVREGVSPIPDGESLPRDYGTHILGAAEPTKTFTVENIGNSTINIASVTVPVGFEIVTPLPASLGPGDEADLVVKLKTDTVGTFTGDIEINSDDPDEDPYNWAVRGVVVAGVCRPVPQHGFLVPRRRSLVRICVLNREYFDHRWVGIEPRPLERMDDPVGGD
jgi:hypothetical protein